MIDATYVAEYRIRLRFSDGAQGEVDLLNELHGSIFEPLKDPAFFRQFSIDPRFKTLVWPNGADFAPEFLRASAKPAS